MTEVFLLDFQVISLLKCLPQNGPLHVTNDYSIVQNNYSWNRLTDAFWIDQPGTVAIDKHN